jgi:hypothetical protein
MMIRTRKSDKVHVCVYRWLFRFCMRWLYAQDKQVVVDNIEAVASKISLKEALETVKFCLVEKGDELWGLDAAYQRHLYSKKGDLAWMREFFNLRTYDNFDMKQGRRQEFANELGENLDDIWVVKYEGRYKLLLQKLEELKLLFLELNDDKFYGSRRGSFAELMSRLLQQELHEECNVGGGRWLAKNSKQKRRIYTVEDSVGGVFQEKSVEDRISSVDKMLHRFRECAEEVYTNIGGNLTNKGKSGADDPYESDEDNDEESYYYYGYEDRTIVTMYPDTTLNVEEGDANAETTQGKVVYGSFTAYGADSKEVEAAWVAEQETSLTTATSAAMEAVAEWKTAKVRVYNAAFFKRDFARGLQSVLKWQGSESLQDVVTAESNYNWECFRSLGGDIVDDLVLMWLFRSDSLLHVYTYEERYEAMYEEFYNREGIANAMDTWACMRAAEAHYLSYYNNYYCGRPWTRSDLTRLRDLVGLEGGRLPKVTPSRLEKRKQWRDPEMVAKFDAFLQRKQKAATAAARTEKRRLQAFHEREYVKIFKQNPLFQRVASMFVEGLLSELHALEQGEPFGGLFAKWAPSLKHNHDKALGMGRVIAENLAVRLGWVEGLSSVEHVTEAMWTDTIRFKYHHDVLSPLRRSACVPESFTARREWALVDYSRVSSTAMEWLRESFIKHDKERFAAFIAAPQSKIHVRHLVPEGVLSGALAASMYLDKGKLELYRLRCSGTFHEFDGDESAKQKKDLSNRQWQGLEQQMQRAVAVGSSEMSTPNCGTVVAIVDDMSLEYMANTAAMATLIANSTTSGGAFASKVVMTGETVAEIVDVGGVVVEQVRDLTTAVEPIARYKGGYNREQRRLHLLKPVELGGWAGKFEAPGRATSYDALDKVMERAKEQGVTPEDFATWTLVFFSDRSLPDPVGTMHSYWYMDRRLPYRKMHDRMHAAGFTQGFPTIVFWRMEDDFDEEFFNGIPVEGCDVEGVVLVSGTSQCTLEDVVGVLQKSHDGAGEVVAHSSSSVMMKILGNKTLDGLRVPE